MVTGDRTFVANFERKTYNVFTSADPLEGGSPAGDDTNIPCGTQITLNANTDECYNFINWTLDGNEVSTNEDYTFTLTGANTLVNIGAGTGSTIQIPINTSYNYSYSQQIFEASEITLSPGAVISSIAFEYIGTYSHMATQSVYLTHTAKSTFVNTSDFIPLSQMQLVFSGSYHYSNSQKWSTITFDQPFVYTGGNLVIAVAKNSGIVPLNSASFTTHAAPNKTLHYYTDATPINPANPLTGSPLSGVLSIRNNFQLHSIETTELYFVANFEIKKFNVTVSENISAGGAASVNGNATNIDCGSSVNVIATTDPCYTFVGWTNIHGDTVSKSANFTFTIKNDTTLTANFVIKKFNVTLSMNPPTGAGTVTGGVTNWDCGEPITVVAVPDECYDFVNWTIGTTVTSTNATYNFDLTGNVNLVANFKIKKFNLTVLKDPPAGNNNEVFPKFPIQDINCGDSVQINAIADMYHNFSDWRDLNGTLVTSSISKWITVKSDTTLVGHFTPKTYTVSVSASPPGGGTATGSGTEIPYNTQWTVTATANAPLFKFSHWEDYGVRLEDAPETYTFPVTGDHDLVAIFVKERVVIHVVAEPDGTGLVFQSAYMPELDSLMHVWAEPAFCHSFTKWATLDGYALQPTNPDFWFTVYPQLYSYIIDGVLTLVAHFKPNTFKIELEPSPQQGGDVFANGAYGGGDFVCEEEIEIEAVPSLHHKFVKWVEVIGADTTWVSYSPVYPFTVKRSRYLVAIFELETFLIKVLPSPGTAGIAGTGGNFHYGDTIPLHAEPFEECTFYNWTDEDDTPLGDDADIDYTVLGAKTIYANFIPKTFTVKVIDFPQSSGYVTENGENIPYNTLWDITAAPIDPDVYEFSHWEEGDIIYDWGPDYTIPVTRDYDLTAVFTKKKYTITLGTVPLEAITQVSGGGTFPHGTPVTVSATNNDCFTFSKWTENGVIVGVNNDYGPFTVTGDRYLVAHFNPVIYDINLLASPAGSGTFGGDGAGSYPCMKEITVVAIPAYCHEFLHWEEDGNILAGVGASYTFTVTGPRMLTAVFAPTHYSITVSAVGGGTAFGDVVDFPCGEEWTVMAFPDDDCYRFLYWTDNGLPILAGSSHTFTVEGNHDFVAHFEFITYNIIAQATGGGTTTGGGVYDCGDTVTLCAVPNPNHHFIKWTDALGVFVTNDLCFTFVADGDYHYIAYFEIDTCVITLSDNPNNAGILTANMFPDGGTFTYGTSVTITATASNSNEYTFLYWKEADTVYTTSPTFTITATAHRHFVAHFSVKHYEILLLWTPSDGGTAQTSGSYPYGMDFTAEAVPNTFHNFVNWTEADTVVLDGGTPAPDHYTFMIAGARTLTAHFEPKTYSVTARPNNVIYGKAERDSSGMAYDTPYEVKATPNTGYKFLHWLEEGNPTPVYYQATYSFLVKKDHNLIAVFAPETYNITHSANPHNGGMTYGGGYNLPYATDTLIWAVPFNNYTFDRWTHEDGTYFSSDNSQRILVTESKHYIAQFIPKEYEVTLSVEPHSGAGIVTGNGWYTSGQIAHLKATPNNGYKFVCWKENGNCIWTFPDYDIVVDRDRHLVAVFTLNTLSIAVEANPTVGGTVEGNKDNIPFGEWHTVIAEPFRPYYYFKNWTEKETGKLRSTDSSYTFQVTESLVLVANFISEEFTITLQTNPANGGTTTGAGIYYYMVSCTASAVANPGYLFTHWTEGGSTIAGAGADYTFDVTCSRTLVAHFEKCDFDLTLAANPPEGGTVSGGGINIPCNKEVTLTATPNTGYNFKEWTDEAGELFSTEPEFVYKGTQNSAFTAHFEPEKYLISVFADPPQNGEVTGAGYYDYGQTATVTATAYDGFMFIHWTENGTEVSKQEVFSFTVTGSRTLVAHFDTLKFTVTVLVNDEYLGEATGGGVYAKNQKIKVKALPNKGYRFKNWTKENAEVSEERIYEFTVTEDVTLTANFYGLEFDEYAATLWDNTFMLDLKRFSEEPNLTLLGCKWFKNDKQVPQTNTIDEFSYSAGPKATDLLEKAPTYYTFHVNTKEHGELYSTRKVIEDYTLLHTPVNPSGLYVYPNPVLTGIAFTVEGATEGSTLYVYNQYGVCLTSAIAKAEATTLTLNIPSGIYLIRSSDNKEAKIVVVNAR